MTTETTAHLSPEFFVERKRPLIEWSDLAASTFRFESEDHTS